MRSGAQEAGFRLEMNIEPRPARRDSHHARRAEGACTGSLKGYVSAVAGARLGTKEPSLRAICLTDWGQIPQTPLLYFSGRGYPGPYDAQRFASYALLALHPATVEINGHR